MNISEMSRKSHQTFIDKFISSTYWSDEAEVNPIVVVDRHEQLAALEGAADAVRPILPEDEERLVPSRRRRWGVFSLLHCFLFRVGRGGALGALRRLLDSESRPARRNFVEI